MESYLLLRNNEQTGPYSFEELVSLSLQPHDLIWTEGRSASWKYPVELDEFKIFVPAVTALEKEYDKPPLSRTRLQNDDILLNGLNTNSEKLPHPIPEHDLYEFPTLARFLMAGYYEQQALDESNSSVLPAQKPVESVKKSTIWVSLPSAVTNKKIILIKTSEKDSVFHRNAQPKFNQPAEFLRTGYPETPENNSNTEFSSVHADPSDKVLHISSKTDFADSSHANEELKIHFIEPAHSKKFYSISLQKFAITIGIASLIMVGSLIANSIINPGYKLKPKELVNRISIKPERAEPEAKLPVPGAILTSNNLPLPPSSANTDSLAAASLAAENESLLAAKKKENAAKKIKDKKLAPVVIPEVAVQEQPPAEKISSAENDAHIALLAEKEETRKNIAQLIEVKLDGYKVGLLGGIKEFELVVKNNSRFPIDRVVVELKYIQSNKKVFKTEILEINSIPANSDKSIEVPKSSRGVKIESSIKSISSADLSLTYSR